MKICTACLEEKPTDCFYLKNKNRLSTYCKSCLNIQVKLKQRETKLKYIQYKGGCCNICFYNKCLGALEFHHLDPNEKEFELSKTLNKTETEIKKELDKCILLCSNCHRETHYDFNLDKLKFKKDSTKELLEKIISLLSEGLPLKEICRTLNLKYESTLTLLTSKNISTKDYKLYNPKYPKKEALEKLLWEKPSNIIAKDLGVSDSALAKHCKKHNINKPTRGYWTKRC